MSNLPRGVRNNNPGNIDYNPINNWQGQLGKEVGVPSPRFCRFDSPENGIRALGKLLRTYYTKHKLYTVLEIIRRWAPEVENDTGAYIQSVAKSCGLEPNQYIKSITDPRVLGGLVRAIIKHENANYAYPEAVLREGIQRALA